jgi:hypothetical protein
MIPPHVRLWHKADILTRGTNVRFWGPPCAENQRVSGAFNDGSDRD